MNINSVPELPRSSEATAKIFKATLAGVAVASLSYFVIWGSGLQPEVTSLAESLGIEDIMRTDTVTNTVYKDVTTVTVEKAEKQLTGLITLGSIFTVIFARAFIIGMRDRARRDRNSNN